MSFEVAADAYDRFMGRYSEPLARTFVDWCGVEAGQRALDVGCGPGALTAALVDRLGPAQVAALDPSREFVAAARARLPEVDVREAAAEAIPWPDDSFDVAMAELVVHFMSDPVAGLREMARVTRSGGMVGACVWDFAGGRSPLTAFWRAVGELRDGHPDEAQLPGTRRGELVTMAEQAGLRVSEDAALVVSVSYDSFEEWWEPYTHGVGPAGAYVASLDDAERADLRARCEELVPPAPFVIRAAAWAVCAESP